MRDEPTRQKLVVWGTSGHASVVADIVRLEGRYDLVGFLDDVNPDRAGAVLCGALVLGGREQLEHLVQEGVEAIVFGFGDCEARLRLTQLVRDKGFELASVVHPRSVVAADVEIGAGSAVVAGAVINPGAKIGENVIVNTCASVGHHCVVEDGAHVCPGVRLAGSVTVGRAAWIGVGATVVDGVRIGTSATVGAGALVLKNVPDGALTYGVPARTVDKGSSA